MTEITESQIRNLCVLLAVVGLGTIHVSHSYIQPDEINVEEIDETMLGDTVKLEAEVVESNEAENAKFLTLDDGTGTIDAVDFDMRDIPSQASFIGRIDVYQGNLQLVMEEIED